jgi:hypothetical protein
MAAIETVFASWNNDRARLYRKMRRIPEGTGTALIVQAMVFGNWDRRSGSGVLFTRDPITGAPLPMGEWAAGAQGEAVVSGRTTPRGLDQFAAEHPGLHAELTEHARRLEREGQDAQDIEYTVQSGRLYLLQGRRLKVTPLAACRIAVDLWREGLIDEGRASGPSTWRAWRRTPLMQRESNPWRWVSRLRRVLPQAGRYPRPKRRCGRRPTAGPWSWCVPRRRRTTSRACAAPWR